MAYTKSFEEIVDYLVNHPNSTLIHTSERIGPLLMYGLHKEDHWVIDCYKSDPDGALTVEAHFHLDVLYDNELIKPDGKVFILKEKTSSLQPAPVKQKPEPEPVFKPQAQPVHVPEYQREIPLAKSYPSPSKQGVHYDTHDDLERAMDSGKSSPWDNTPSHFWHITEIHNAIAIINCGFFMSRNMLKGRVPFDNIVNCQPTNSVMSTNYSNRIKQFVRFYLRPRFKFTCAYVRNVRSSSLVQFSVSRHRIFRALQKHYINEPALMLSYSGHYASYEDLSFHNQINSAKKLREKDFSDFNWKYIYRYYDPNLPDEIKDAQFAEFIIADRLECDFIDGIFFSKESDRKAFLAGINPSLPSKFEKMCSVEPSYFFED